MAPKFSHSQCFLSRIRQLELVKSFSLCHEMFTYNIDYAGRILSHRKLTCCRSSFKYQSKVVAEAASDGVIDVSEASFISRSLFQYYIPFLVQVFRFAGCRAMMNDDFLKDLMLRLTSAYVLRTSHLFRCSVCTVRVCYLCINDC